MKNTTPKTTRDCVHAMLARDFACEARLAGAEASPGDDLQALRTLSVPARRALYEYAVRTALGPPDPEGDDAALLSSGADPTVGARLLRFLRTWVERGPDGLEG